MYFSNSLQQDIQQQKPQIMQLIVDNNMPRNKKLISPLRYPGSKKNLIPYIIKTLNANNLKPEVYIEPFVGGGSIALGLLCNGLTNRAILVDKDPWITSFWKTVFFDTDWLIEQIENVEVTLDRWYWYKNQLPKTIREMAFTCLFLNRTNFSGILCDNVGPLGGKKQESQYKIDCRFTKQTRLTLIDRISDIAAYKDNIYDIWNCSWEESLIKIKELKQAEYLHENQIFFYFDPPFYNEADSLYRYSFKNTDHIKLRDTLSAMTDNWVLSYDYADEIKKLYHDAIETGANGTTHHDFEITYTIASVSQRKKGKEIILTNLPNLPDYTNS